MAQDLQKLKNEIWYAKQALEKQEASHAEWAAQVRGIPPLVSLLAVDQVTCRCSALANTMTV
jgi:hypothetical protein